MFLIFLNLNALYYHLYMTYNNVHIIINYKRNVQMRNTNI